MAAITKYRTLRGLFASEDRWIKNEMARSKKGGKTYEGLNPTSPRATCFCLSGGAHRVYGDFAERRVAYKKMAAAIRKLFPAYAKTFSKKDHITNTSLIINFNDDRHRTHADVLAVVKEAKV